MISAAVVGVRGIGAGHAKLLAELPEYRLLAVCDLNAETLAALNPESLGAKGYTDFAALLATEKPDVVVVATPNSNHFSLSMQALDAGIKGLYCEKPMTVHLGDARALTARCKDLGVAFAVNHQRRLNPEIVALRKEIESGSIGEIEVIRSSNAGDVLSDGTHAIDSVRYLLGDRPAEWVYGQVFRKQHEGQAGAGFDPSGGFRFGHPIEDAAMAVVGFAGGVRAEFFVGELFPQGRWYQDYDVIGTKGRLWRPSDSLKPPLRRQQGEEWVPVDFPPADESSLHQSFRAFAQSVLTGAPHPLDGATHGLAAMEIVTAIYESAHIHQRIDLPVNADRFPLEVMLS